MTTKQPALAADVAINEPGQDRLGRTPLAKTLARAIQNLDGDDSFVFGLCGAWGSGKTSVLNLVLKELEAVEEEERPVVVRFNPWWFSGRSQLLEAFLGQFGAAIAVSEKGKVAGQASAMFQKLSSGLRPFSFLPLVGEAVKTTSDVAKGAAEVLKMYTDAVKTDVYKARQEIDEQLRKFDRRIIVVMDDIDRLTADEMGELFLILKAVADFPKTVYLLAFDEKVVRRAIQKKLEVNGKTYLEKIVQMQVELPFVGHTAIHEMFFEQVSELLDEQEVTGQFRQQVGNIFHDGVKFFLTTPRASKRLLNTLRFTYPALKGEVHFPDLLGIATLFTFVLAVAQVIANNSDRFAGTMRGREDHAAHKAFHEGWLDKVSEETRPHVRGIVKRLFPKCAWALGGSMYGTDWEGAWRKSLLVRSPYHFDKYFLWAVPEGAITETEWNEIVEEMLDNRRLEARLVSMSRERGQDRSVSRVKELLDRLDTFVRTSKDKARVASAFTAVMAQGDLLVEVGDEQVVGGLMPLDNRLRVLRILYGAIENTSVPRTRAKLVMSAIENGCGLMTAGMLLDSLGDEHGMFGKKKEDDDKREPLLAETDVRRAIRALVRKIREASAGDTESTLAGHPFSLHLVRDWSQFGAPKPATRWLRRQARRDDFLLALIEQASSKFRVHGMGDHVAHVGDTVDTAFLGRFLDLKHLKARCSKMLSDSDLNPRQRARLETAISLIDEQGKPIDPGDLRRRRVMSGETEDG